MSERFQLRPEVEAFARLMELKLRENDHKGGWRHDCVGDLLQLLREEAAELKEALRSRVNLVNVPPALDREGRALIGREAADVANFAMMIADVCGALKGTRS